MRKKKYYLYCKDTAAWTAEDENKYDYMKLSGKKIYFLSNTALPETNEAVADTADVEQWLVSCEAALIQSEQGAEVRKIKKAVKQLEKDFRAELEKELAKQNCT